MSKKPPRNKVVRNCGELTWTLVAPGLWRGKTYDDVREELVAAGIAEKDLPSDGSFGAFRKSKEYRGYVEQRTGLVHEAEEKRAFWELLQEQGVHSAVQLAMFESLCNLRRLSANLEDVDDAAALNREYVRLNKAFLQNAKLQMLEREAQRVEDAESAVAGSIDSEDLARRMDELMGVPVGEDSVAEVLEGAQ